MSQESSTIGSDNFDSQTFEIGQIIEAIIPVQPSIPRQASVLFTLEQSPIVRRILEQFGAGSSVSGIARELTDALIPAQGGGRWHPLTVRRVLLNETYTGRTIYRRTKASRVRDPLTGKMRRRVTERDQSERIDIPDATPRMVEPELFARV